MDSLKISQKIICHLNVSKKLKKKTITRSLLNCQPFVYWNQKIEVMNIHAAAMFSIVFLRRKFCIVYVTIGITRNLLVSLLNSYCEMFSWSSSDDEIHFREKLYWKTHASHNIINTSIQNPNINTISIEFYQKCYLAQNNWHSFDWSFSLRTRKIEKGSKRKDQKDKLYVCKMKLFFETIFLKNSSLKIWTMSHWKFRHTDVSIISIFQSFIVEALFWIIVK